MRAGLLKKLSTKELMLLNCGVREDSWESLRKLLRSNKSILKEINPGCALEELTLKLKLQYFGHLMWRANSLEKTLMLGKIEMVGWHYQLNGHESEQTPGDSEGQGTWHAAVHEVTNSQTWLSNWATTTCTPTWHWGSALSFRSKGLCYISGEKMRRNSILKVYA